MQILRVKSLFMYSQTYGNIPDMTNGKRGLNIYKEPPQPKPPSTRERSVIRAVLRGS